MDFVELNKWNRSTARCEHSFADGLLSIVDVIIMVNRADNGGFYAETDATTT